MLSEESKCSRVKGQLLIPDLSVEYLLRVQDMELENALLLLMINHIYLCVICVCIFLS